ncbi:low-density lipoprotein receptor-related protein 10 [Amia ocellicauda]|uniref:low-density lipoprotein receptor-related protein 10 n=1 Tax=Amia ocellicauda TaxID=2972642 RepID=UPI003464E1E7
MALSPRTALLLSALCWTGFGWSSTQLTANYALCSSSPRILSDRKGDIKSFGDSTQPVNCTWLISAPLGESVTISFSRFKVQCGGGWVKVWSSGGGTHMSLCGGGLPKPLHLPGGNITVMHHIVPQQRPNTGFQLSYIRGSAPCLWNEFPCIGGGCLTSGWRCNGQRECLAEGDGSDEEGCGGVETEEGGWWRLWDGPREQDNVTEGEMRREALYREERERHWVRQSKGGECGGFLQDFYGWFAPPTGPLSSGSCQWTVAPGDHRPIRLDLTQLDLSPGDYITVTDQPGGLGETLAEITSSNGQRSLSVESRTGLISLTYRRAAGSDGWGFNATYRIAGFCLPWEGVCGGAGPGAGPSCYTEEQRCDGHWDCQITGRDEEGCWGCPPGQFACGGGPGVETAALGPRAGRGQGFLAAVRATQGRRMCYPPQERCNYQLLCADGADERACAVCQPGTFHCDTDRCVFETWVCDGQVDCKDGTDEMNCSFRLPRKVITAATVGSLVCGLLLVIAMGCTCKLYSLRTREYSLFASITREEAEFIQQQAPPSYGQLIAQGVIPPVEDFPTESPTQSSSLSLRGLLQLLRQEPGSTHPAGRQRRHRRPRIVRRTLRRLRRWGLLPRSAPRAAPSSSQQPAETPTIGLEAGESEGNVGGSPLGPGEGGSLSSADVLPQKPGLLSQTTPRPPVLPPAAAPAPAPAPLRPDPGLASFLRALGLSMPRMRPSAPPAPHTLPLSSSANATPSEDEVLLIPLSEDPPTPPPSPHPTEEDVPMLT